MMGALLLPLHSCPTFALRSTSLNPPHLPRGIRRRTPAPILPPRPFISSAAVPSLGITGVSNQRLLAVHASNFDHSNNGNVVEGKSGSGNSSGPNGPPVATILAGVVVFLMFLWILGSLVLWVIGLIVNVPPSTK